MKITSTMKSLLIVTGLVIIVTCVNGQTDKGIHYQAVARDPDGGVMAEKELTVRIGIIDQEPDHEVVWLEEHQVLTSSFGTFSLTIGNDPRKRIGGTLETFEMIPWHQESYALNVLVGEPGGDFVDLGTSPIMAVPYALSSGQVSQPVPQFSIRNNGKLPAEQALFEVKRADGRPVFAVYEDGVWVYTDTSETKGVKGGFAVGGYRPSKKGEVVEEYMRVTPDSVRIYINEEPLKGVKGGFAVGGYRRSNKAPQTDYMSVFSDSIRFYVNYSPGKQGRHGGFAISGVDPMSGKQVTYMFLTPDNYFIGEESGAHNTTGRYNTVVGYRAGEQNTEGSENVMLGHRAGNQNITGSKNIFIGEGAGEWSIESMENVCVGIGAGASNNGAGNLFLGTWSGTSNEGSGNVFIGSGSGHSLQGSDMLVIDNADLDPTQSLIYGKFDENKIRLNANVGINTEPDTAFALKTTGSIEALNVTETSDARYKTGIHSIQKALEMVLSMEGVRYRWNREDYPEKDFDQEVHLGFVAQELEKVVPELVVEGSDGYKSVNYQKVSTILVEAMKQQQQMLEEKDQQIRDLENRLERIESIVLD
ncbi:MAG: tail fiber domain-containing protein [Bacteroidales bacterium]